VNASTHLAALGTSRPAAPGGGTHRRPVGHDVPGRVDGDPRSKCASASSRRPARAPRSGALSDAAAILAGRPAPPSAPPGPP